MKKVIEILMNRDNMTKEEAERLVSRVSNEVTYAIENGNYDEVEDIMYTELGLEMDYIEDILYL